MFSVSDGFVTCKWAAVILFYIVPVFGHLPQPHRVLRFCAVTPTLLSRVSTLRTVDRSFNPGNAVDVHDPVLTHLVRVFDAEHTQPCARKLKKGRKGA